MFRLLKNRALSLRLKSKLILSFMLTSVCILLLFALIFYRYTSNALLDQSERSTLSSLSQLETNLTTVLDTVSTVSKNIMVSSYFSEEMKLDQINSPDDVKLINDIYDFFSAQMSSYDYIHSIVYYGSNGMIIGSSSQKDLLLYDSEKKNFFYHSELFTDLNQSGNPVLRGAFRYSDFFPGSYPDSLNTRYISLGQRLATMRQAVGYVIINVDESYIRSLYHDDSRKLSGESLLLDSRNRILSCEDKDLIGSMVLMKPLDSENENVIHLTLKGYDIEKLNASNQIIFYPYKDYGLSIIYEIPYRTLFSNIHQLKTLLVLFLAVFIILDLILSLFWISAITKPLTSLITAMKSMGKGKLGTKLETSDSSDFRFLADQFNQMSQSIQRLIRENEVIQEERHELALQNLQAQLNPHFLYNTLNTIKWMAIVSKASNVADCVTALGNLLQPIFRNTKTTWPLEEELNYLKNYLRIMNYRTGAPIDFSASIEPGLLSCQVPKFILQPLVENAVTHSNPSAYEKNYIHLEGRGRKHSFVLTLHDNGLGIPAETLSALNHLLTSQENWTKPLDRASLPPGIGIGILNTNRKIKLQYGASSGLTVDSIYGQGTTLTLTFTVSADSLLL